MHDTECPYWDLYLLVDLHIILLLANSGQPCTNPSNNIILDVPVVLQVHLNLWGSCIVSLYWHVSVTYCPVYCIVSLYWHVSVTYCPVYCIVSLYWHVSVTYCPVYCIVSLYWHVSVTYCPVYCIVSLYWHVSVTYCPVYWPMFCSNTRSQMLTKTYCMELSIYVTLCIALMEEHM